MYWPIGAPRVYAPTNSGFSAARIPQYDDDIESAEATKESASFTNPSSTGAAPQEDDKEPTSGLLTPVTPMTPGVPKPVEYDAAHKSGSAKTLGILEEKLEQVISKAEGENVLALKLSRSGHLFAVITATSLTVWQAKPTVILAVVVRSESSLNKYGPNVDVLVRPDSAIFVVQTTNGYLITYSLASDPEAQAYQPHFPANISANTRRQSNFPRARNLEDRILWGPGEGGGIREVSLRFRMVIKVESGITKALALDDELVVATEKPAAIQCIRWTPDSTGNQTSNELLSRMGWLPKKSTVVDMVYNRPMNLSTWVTSEGQAFAVQRLAGPRVPADVSTDVEKSTEGEVKKSDPAKKLFRGYCFHSPEEANLQAVKTAINARFSLIAVGCENGSISVYTARDYVGNIPLSHRLKPMVSSSSSGRITFLTYSPDGYCLFVGYEQGWATWSVYGKPGCNSFGANQDAANSNEEGWLRGVTDGTWLSGGSEILLVGRGDTRIWVLEMARSAVVGCFAAANIARIVLQTRSGIMVYKGYDLPDLTTISLEASLWHTAQIPMQYLTEQWPMRCTVISSDGRYIAVAGRRGLVHYSVTSGRWKTFVDDNVRNSFQVRGGMCWHQHILVAAVEAGDSYGLRLYSRESALDSPLHSEDLPAPVVLLALSGDDTLLVYTHDNLLYHYLFASTGGVISIVQVGQIAFHGIIRSPARVRGLSWIVPDEQLQDGDPAKDVIVATVLFLVDGKLVVLQPSLNEERQLKYDMRVVAQNVEYYALIRDLTAVTAPTTKSTSLSRHESENGDILQDSLWIFDGNEMRLWTNVQDLLQSAPAEMGRDPIPTIAIQVDFYPLSVLLSKGILLGIEPDLVQRMDINFTFFRFAIRTHLFVPQLLKFHLSRDDSSAAHQMARQYQTLEYFAHALEILLHDVLDEEVDTNPSADAALLPRVLSFLSAFPQYLDIIVQCTRKTEVRSWRTLFAYLPPPAELFEESLQRGSLKTAGGYLLVLHTFEDLSSNSGQLVRLLARAKNEGDWELCKELARFLAALDESGATLREALELVELSSPRVRGKDGAPLFDRSRLTVPVRKRSSTPSRSLDGSSSPHSTSSGSRSPLGMLSPVNVLDVSGSDVTSPEDYFSAYGR